MWRWWRGRCTTAGWWRPPGGTIQLVLLAPSGHPLAGRRVSWEEVAAEVLLIREPGSGTRRVVLEGLREAGLVPGRSLELGSNDSITQGVAAGLGVAFASAASAADQLALGRVAQVQVAGLSLHRTLSRLSVSGRRRSRAAAAFEAMLE